MQPFTSVIKCAIYVKGLDKQRIEAEVAKLNEYLITNCSTLADNDQVYVDSDNSLTQLAKLVEQAPDKEVLVVYVSHDLPPEDRELYKTLINKLYVQGISILLCE
jgi:hypothetical protein